VWRGPFVETLPASGKVGAAVIILGNNQTDASSVTFSGTPAMFIVLSVPKIQTTMPGNFGCTPGTTRLRHGGCVALQTLSREVICAGRTRNRTALPFFLAASRARKNYLVARFSHHRFFHEAMLSNTPSRIISACIMAPLKCAMKVAKSSNASALCAVRSSE
jgi:hypothetical protein